MIEAAEVLRRETAGAQTRQSKALMILPAEINLKSLKS